jgi:hypothetical protein
MSALFSVLARLLFLIAAAIFLTSLLVAGVLLAAVWLVWNLLRGRRPVWPTLHRFQGPWSGHPVWGKARSWPPPAARSPAEESVVDVEAREVPPRPGSGPALDHPRH